MLNYNRGVATPTTIREWLRKNEANMTLEQLGNDSSTRRKTATIYHVEREDEMSEGHEAEDNEEQHEIHALERGLSELQASSAGDDLEDGILSEGEAAEVLSTLLAKKKQTYTQTLKAKKHHELSRGYSKPPAQGFARRRDDRPARFKISGDLTIDEIKKKTRCSRCLQVGHWWKECPNPPVPGRAAAGGGGKNTEKEANFLEEEVFFCGLLDAFHEDPPPEELPTTALLPEYEDDKLDKPPLLENIDDESRTAEIMSNEVQPADLTLRQDKMEKPRPLSQAVGHSGFSERATAHDFEKFFHGEGGQKTPGTSREAIDRL